MPAAEAVRIHVTCDNCGKGFETVELAVPYPNYAADNHSDSEREEEYEEVCPHCGKSYSIDVINGCGGGTVIIHDLKEDSNAECNEIYFDDYIQEEVEEYCKSAPNFAYFTFGQSMEDIKKAVNELGNLSPEVQQIMIRLLFANVIGCLEAYLSFTLKKNVITSPKYKRRFVETFRDFSSEKLTLNDIYERMDNIDTKILKSLNELMYHNLAKIQGIYKSTFGISFGPIDSLCKKINVLHDIVHRNGNDKDGNPTKVEISDLTNLISEVESYVHNIENQISKLEM